MSDSEGAAIPLPFMPPSGWSAKPLHRLCTLLADGDWVELKDQGGGRDFRLLQISNIGLGEFVETGKYRWITAETFRRLRCTEIKAGDVLVARMPEPTGRCWYVNALPWPAVTAVDVAIVRTDESQLNGRFLSYYLNSPQCLAAVASLTTGTTRLRIRRADIGRLTVPVPPILEQRAIAEVLGALDDKIEANHREITTAWSVAATRFQLVTECDEVELVPLGDLADLAYGKSLPERVREPGIVPVFGSGGIVGHHSAALVRGPGVIVGRKGTAGAVHWCQSDFFPIDTTFYVQSDELPMEFLYFALRSLGLDRMNSDSAVPGLNRSAALARLIPLPKRGEVDAFSRVASPLAAMVAAAEQESKALAAMRDTLLPKLLSGELRVRDAESLVGGAV